MAYKSDTVARTVKCLNDMYFLPAIQREFVWSTEQIVKLFDSIMRGYPISSFLYWKLDPANRDKWQSYWFVQNAKTGGTHNEVASVAGVPDLTITLDGQQRLTSLLIGLKGTYTIKKPNMWWNNPQAWERRKLYLDLLKDASAEAEDGEEGIRYGFEFLKDPTNKDGRFWFEVGTILRFDDEDKFYDFKESVKESLPDEATQGQRKTLDKNLDRLYRAIWKDEAISYYVEMDQNYDRVLDIFVRANAGGTQLSKSDLLLSMITAKWSGIDAKEDIYGFVDQLNERLDLHNSFDKDFVMKSCLVLADLPVGYKVQNFSNKNLDKIRDLWADIKRAIERCVRLVNLVGIDRETLTSANALIPIAYYFLKQPSTTLLGTTPFEAKNFDAIRGWLLMVLVNNVFGGASDTALTEVRRALQDDASQDFPVEAISAGLASLNRQVRFDDTAVENFLAITYSKPTSFLALSLLSERTHWGEESWHKDHIFPQSWFASKNLHELGFDKEKQERYMDAYNRLANLQLLTQHENTEKSSAAFEDWVKTRDSDFRRRHLIPDDDDLLRFENFEAFIEAREGLIRERLAALFGTAKEARV